MPARKRKTLDDVLAELAEIRRHPDTEGAGKALRSALRGRSSHAAAKAAQIIGEASLDGWLEQLCDAFDRMMEKAVQRDPGCSGKTAIVTALQELGANRDELYLRGIRHRQLEPVWGGRVDTAVGLRGASALALSRSRYSGTLDELAMLLADEERDARCAAAQTMVYHGDPAAVPLLRYKVAVGDDDGEVLTESMRALLELEPTALEQIVAYLDDRCGLAAESASLAIAGARVAGAFPVLRDWWERAGEPALRSTAALALAMLRSPEATDHLLAVLADGNGGDARHALRALAVLRHDGRVRDRVLELVQSRQEASLDGELAEWFAD